MKIKSSTFMTTLSCSIIILFFMAVSFVPPSYGLPSFTDDFEGGNLDNWTIGGRQLAGTNIADVVNCGTGSLCGHLFHTSFTEITMYKNFEYDSSNSGTFHFDLEVDVNSQPAPDAYYGMAGVEFYFLDSGGNTLGSVWYVAATTNFPFTLGTATRSVNQISENVMEHYAIDVSDMLSQITIDESQITDIQMLLITYSSTYHYPSVSAELWIDNVSTEPMQEIDCFDGMDNDGDDLTDCEDPDCDATVGPATTCGAGVCAAQGSIVCEMGALVNTCQPGDPTEPDTEMTCDDELDNDCDGLTDMDDSDCASRRVTICHKGKNTITISSNALPAHLDHGDTVGPCPDDANKEDKHNKKN